MILPSQERIIKLCDSAYLYIYNDSAEIMGSRASANFPAYSCVTHAFDIFFAINYYIAGNDYVYESVSVLALLSSET